MLHENGEYNSIEREIVDLASIAPADYCLGDALVCKERAKTEYDPAVRRNMVLAGPDMVAVDTVCAQLMGLNPDDVAHLCEAAREGLGTNRMSQIHLLGEHSIDESVYYFERPPENSRGTGGIWGRQPCLVAEQLRVLICLPHILVFLMLTLLLLPNRTAGQSRSISLMNSSISKPGTVHPMAESIRLQLDVCP